jgi:hypothetical protein
MRITTNGAAMPVRGPPAGAGIVRAAPAVGRILTALLISSTWANAATLTSPGWLQVTLTFMPFSYYATYCLRT